VRGKKIVTIEGLADATTGALSPVQQGVIDEQGFQCAFCMPGFVMAPPVISRPIRIRRGRNWRTAFPATCAAARDYDKILTALMKGAEHMRKA
jgi:aerobic-type carbon monoxide dehydrogenase small subunit (CoxS/CutS family)